MSISFYVLLSILGVSYFIYHGWNKYLDHKVKMASVAAGVTPHEESDSNG